MDYCFLLNILRPRLFGIHFFSRQNIWVLTGEMKLNLKIPTKIDFDFSKCSRKELNLGIHKKEYTDQIMLADQHFYTPAKRSFSVGVFCFQPVSHSVIPSFHLSVNISRFGSVT